MDIAVKTKNPDFFRDLTLETEASGEIRILDATDDIIEKNNE